MKISFVIFFCLIFLTYIETSLSEENDDFLSKDFLENLENKEGKRFKKFVKLKILNKITAHFVTVRSEVGKFVHFGNLSILPKICWRSRSEDFTENKLLLKLYEKIPQTEKKEIFYGWMFSSTPSISSLEHPVYDITILKCEN